MKIFPGKLAISLFCFIFFIVSLPADESVLKKSQASLDSALMKQKKAAFKRIKERQVLLKELSILRVQVAQVQHVSKAYSLQENDFQLNLSSAVDQSVRINRELKSFYAKFQAAKIEHNLSRVISYLGVAGQIEEVTSDSLLDFFAQLQEEELQATKFQKISSEYVNYSNEKIKGKLFLAGNIGGYAIEPSVGLVVISGDTAVIKKGGSFSDKQKSLLKNSELIHSLPFDITGGEALQMASDEPSVWERIKQGGVIVYPILFVGFAGSCIVFLKFLILLSVGGSSLLLEKKIMEAAKSGAWDQLVTQLQGSKKYIQRLLCSSLEKRGDTKENFEGFVEEQIYGYIPQLEKMMPTLNILGVISPLLGLLGTVTGMIATFDVIAVHGAGDPGLLSRGISEALITTQLGLVVAVPIILFHSLLSSKIEKNINEMEMAANLLVSQLYQVTNDEGDQS